MFKIFLSVLLLPIFYFIFAIGQYLKRKVQELNKAYREEMERKRK